MARKTLEEAYKRLLPATAYLFGTSTGFAASVAVFTTWVLKNLYKNRKGARLEEDEREIARLLSRIKEQEARIRLLEKAREKLLAEGKPTTRVDEAIAVEKRVLEDLELELELRQLRAEALRKLQEVGDRRVLAEVRRLIEKIERGGELDEQEYRVLKALEEQWERRILEITVLRKVLGYG